MLFQIIKYRSDLNLDYKIISLGETHYYESALRDMGIPVVELSITKHPISSLLKLYKEVKKADSLCCWMYHSNLIGLFVGKLAGIKQIIWCIRHSNLDERMNSPLTMRINKLCGKLSKKIDVVAYNGQAARKAHENIGYFEKKGVVLNNGCDCTIFSPNPSSRKRLHEEFRISDEKTVILSVTRNHPIKDIPTFIEAFSLLKAKKKNSVAIMCGSGVTSRCDEIIKLCKGKGLIVGDDIRLLGPRSDVSYLMAGSDLFCLHSAGEAFPNTLIQAMASGCLCVATDVGEVRKVLNNKDWIVKSGNATEMAEKMTKALSLSGESMYSLRQEFRNRVLHEYNIEKVVKEYEKIFEVCNETFIKNETASTVT